jgi:hypothetical protein
MSFYISTQEYNNYREGRTSPCDTDEDREIFKKNRQNIRKKIEEELLNIPNNERKELFIYMKRMYSDYVEQLIDIKIIKKNLDFFEVYPDIIKYSGFDTDKNYNLVTNSDIGLDNYIWNDNVWNNFDYTAYYQKCIKCNKEIKQIGIKNIICKDCKEKEVKDEFINNFKKSSPNDKLKFYGKQKLLTLAKNKKIKGLYTMTKNELINNLSSIVSEQDFPIK